MRKVDRTLFRFPRIKDQCSKLTCKSIQYPQSFSIPCAIGTVPIGLGMPNLVRSDSAGDVGNYEPWLYYLKSGRKVDNAVFKD